MEVDDHVSEFAGLPVRDYRPDEGIVDPEGSAQRLRLEYEAAEGGATLAALLEPFLADPAASRVSALVIGVWQNASDPGADSSRVVAALVAARDRLPGLRALFLGDIISEECEISWICQSDVTPLLDAFPGLEHLRIRGVGEEYYRQRGSQVLELGEVRHEGLRSLVIESGGLPGRIVRAVGRAELPNLEHLELWLGSANYGGDATVEDLAPILSGTAFPALKSLGLRDSESADELAPALAVAPVLRRIEVLDLSLGTLGDAGALALLQGGNLSGLKRLDIHHHYVSDEVLDGLKALGIELDARDRQDEGEYGRFCAVSE